MTTQTVRCDQATERLVFTPEIEDRIRTVDRALRCEGWREARVHMRGLIAHIDDPDRDLTLSQLWLCQFNGPVEIHAADQCDLGYWVCPWCERVHNVETKP